MAPLSVFFSRHCRFNEKGRLFPCHRPSAEMFWFASSTPAAWTISQFGGPSFGTFVEERRYARKQSMSPLGHLRTGSDRSPPGAVSVGEGRRMAPPPQRRTGPSERAARARTARLQLIWIFAPRKTTVAVTDKAGRAQGPLSADSDQNSASPRNAMGQRQTSPLITARPWVNPA